MKNLLMSKDRKLRLFLVVSFAVLLVGAMPLSGQSAGYDLLQTGSGASVDLSSVGLGNVALQGVPIQSSTGSTDTIMHRTQDVIGGGTTPVNVTALFMKSTSSKTFQGQQVDVYVTLNNSGGAISTSVLPQPDSLSASTGTATFRTDGTFDSSITVNADVIFVKAGTSVTDSANYVGHQAASSITLTSSGSSWSSTPPAGYPSSSTFPSGGIYPRPVHNGPHPVVPSTCNTTLSPASPTSPTTTSAARPGAAKNGAQTIGTIAVKACISSVQ